LEFLFVVESKDDLAYHAVSRLISEYKVSGLPRKVYSRDILKLFIYCNLIRYNFQDNLEAKVVVAGLSTTCSQKIHNQLVCKWLCFHLLCLFHRLFMTLNAHFSLCL